MRNRVVSAAVIAFFCSGAIAGPKEEAIQLSRDWARAFNAQDLEGIVKLYAPDALFFGTASKALVTTPDGIRSYFQVAFGLGPQASFKDASVAILSETAAVVAGLDDVSGSIGRVTFVVGKTEAGWKIVHFHRSRQP